MTCQEFLEFIAAYLDGELPSDVQESFQRHVQACPPCVVYLDGYRLTIDVAKTACDAADPSSSVCDDVPEELIRAILQAQREARGGSGGDQAR